MEIIYNFERYIKEEFFEVVENPKFFRLEEKKGEPYEVILKVSREESKFLLIRDIEKLKKDFALYLKNHPKDCDYIILDLYDKVIYLIELKDTETSSSEFVAQLKSGQCWLNHLLFCCKSDNIVDDWNYKRVGIRYQNSRPTKMRKPKVITDDDSLHLPAKYYRDVDGVDLFLLKGKEFFLESLIR